MYRSTSMNVWPRIKGWNLIKANIIFNWLFTVISDKILINKNIGDGAIDSGGKRAGR